MDPLDLKVVADSIDRNVPLLAQSITHVGDTLGVAVERVCKSVDGVTAALNLLIKKPLGFYWGNEQ